MKVTMTLEKPKLYKQPVEVVGSTAKTKIHVQDLNLFYGEKQALFSVNLDIKENEVTALIY